MYELLFPTAVCVLQEQEQFFFIKYRRAGLRIRNPCGVRFKSCGNLSVLLKKILS